VHGNRDPLADGVLWLGSVTAVLMYSFRRFCHVITPLRWATMPLLVAKAYVIILALPRTVLQATVACRGRRTRLWFVT
jgi:hypothetical protein